MATMIISDLILSGIVRMIENKFFSDDRTQRIIEETDAEVKRMSGIMVSMRQEWANVQTSVAHLEHHMAVEKCRTRRNEILHAMPSEDLPIREKALCLSMMVQTLLEETSLETLCIEVSRMLPDEEDPETFYESSQKAYFQRTRTSYEMVNELLSLECTDRLLSGVQHRTDDRMNIAVTAWAPGEKELPKLAMTSGALYQFCQTLCDCIADPRGVYATVVDDGDITQSRSVIRYNASRILLSYDWPSPLQLNQFNEVLTSALTATSAVDRRTATDEISKALERRGKRQVAKNIYLIGQTGEGKSTLANAFTGSNNFRVSNAGTGTFDISGCLVQRGGALDCDDHIMVWDTPGMNDQDGLDQMFENKLYGHLTREQTVSTILIVSKDGCRFPGTLKDMLRIYQKAFGESLLSCIAVLIGIRLEDTERGEIKQKRRFWVTQVSKELGYNLPRERVYFYNARSIESQKELSRLRTLVTGSKTFLTGSGNTIYQGILTLQTERNQREREITKARMYLASKEVMEQLKEEVLLQPRVRFNYIPKENSVQIKLLQSRLTALRMFLKTSNSSIRDRVINAITLGTLRDSQASQSTSNLPLADEEEEHSIVRKKEIWFSCRGEKAEEVLENAGQLPQSMGDKDRFNMFMRRAERKQLMLAKMESETSEELDQDVQISNYEIFDADETLDTEFYARIQAIIKGLIYDRHVAEILIDVLEEMDGSKGPERWSISSGSTREF